MNILITGATGFVGKHLVEKLRVDNNLFLIVRPNSHFEGLGVDNVFVFSDNTSELADYMKQNKIDGVIHLASLYIAEHKTEDIKDLVSSNVYFGTALLEACKTAHVKWFLNTGTIWQNYNSPDYSDEYHPVNLYAASKQAFMTMAQFYLETSDIRFCTLKLCDTYGPNDTRRKIFALFKQISESGETLSMSPGDQKIDILHIDDVVAGFTKLACMLDDGKCELKREYVLTSGRQVSLKELASDYEKKNNVKLNINWGGRPYRKREVMIPYKGNVLEGWSPKHNF